MLGVRKTVERQLPDYLNIFDSNCVRHKRINVKNGREGGIFLKGICNPLSSSTMGRALILFDDYIELQGTPSASSCYQETKLSWV